MSRPLVAFVPCTIAGCNRPQRNPTTPETRPWCTMHYKRWERTGKPEGLSVAERYEMACDAARRGWETRRWMA